MTYDIAVSFAGEQREYVVQFVEACKARGISVFYDRDLTNDWWGKNFIREQRKVYGKNTRYFLPFISTEYLAKPVPRDEFSAAMITAVNRGDGYVLPVLWGHVEVPTDLLHPHIHHLRADDYTPEQLAEAVARRIGVGGQQPARDISEVVQEALEYRMPKVVPQNFSTYRELDITYDYLADQLQAAVHQLESIGFVGTVRRGESKIAVRIERQGQTVYGLDIEKGGPYGDSSLNFVIGTHRVGAGGSSSNGHATPFFDREAQVPKLRMFNLSVFQEVGGPDREYTKEEFFAALWDRIVEQIEC
ncbi:toll/interleukin-1 receptor domain-containing protein [Amycolatopsis sp. OK19-0408]|uniref:Toll/interleukin-1 receptor domain-containing protein n=1 Tax=Amycolatopsis iheyensis TaxID=2945988 RepID=A0A9X2SJ19_9PSEU|nr:toll/interleukin-1 receptor domain-containing protein [Amycolatopsis iheyensis]MCR6483999.1 toll/interleukin-1 receptor domain-containing protein [Amycolatopsis iheyensis]